MDAVSFRLAGSGGADVAATGSERRRRHTVLSNRSVPDWFGAC